MESIIDELYNAYLNEDIFDARIFFVKNMPNYNQRVLT